jgi:putative peptidoglycan lipid II flippase
VTDAPRPPETAAAPTAPAKEAPPARRAPPPGGGKGALLVGAGIFLSRIVGLVRELALAHFLGNSPAANVFKAALRIPNILQNLFGEGVLSASFIPVYAGLVGKGEHAEARRVAGGVLGLLALVTALLTALGVLATPWLVDVIAGGYEGEMRALTVRVVRILFPGVGLLVLSAWCLGILNSHRHFFLSYAAPVLWNLALIGTLLAVGVGGGEERLVVALAWGAVLGSALQLGVQVPQVLRLAGGVRPRLTLAEPGVRKVVRSFGPVVVGRGVVQLSSYVDTALATFVSATALAPLTYGQTLYMLPISLFGMSVSAAELPELARAGAGADTPEAHARVRERLGAGRRRITFLVVPSAAAFLLLGDVVSGGVLGWTGGAFGPADARVVWAVLAGATVGLVASTLGRLYSSALYAAGDTRSPLRFALARVGLGAALAVALVFGTRGHVPDAVRVALLPAASGVAAWLEFHLLRGAVHRRVGVVDAGAGLSVRLWGAALLAGGGALGVKALLARLAGAAPDLAGAGVGTFLPAPDLNPLLVALPVLGVFGALYFGLCHGLGVQEARSLVGGILRRVRRR